MKTRSVFVATAVFLVVALTACAPRISQANFDRVEDDMTLAEVTAILGEPTESSSLGVGPFSGTSAVWENEDVVVTIQFLNDKVKLKHLERR